MKEGLSMSLEQLEGESEKGHIDYTEAVTVDTSKKVSRTIQVIPAWKCTNPECDEIVFHRLVNISIDKVAHCRKCQRRYILIVNDVDIDIDIYAETQGIPGPRYVDKTYDDKSPSE